MLRVLGIIDMWPAQRGSDHRLVTPYRFLLRPESAGAEDGEEPGPHVPAPSGARNNEVQRLLGLGATLVVDRREPDDSGWAVLADPDGNEFCVLRGPEDPPVLRG